MATETFDSTALAGYIEMIDQYIENIKKEIEEVDDMIDKALQQSDVKAGLSSYAGSRLKNIWVNNSISYDNLVPILENWSNALKNIYGINKEAMQNVSAVYAKETEM